VAASQVMVEEDEEQKQPLSSESESESSVLSSAIGPRRVLPVTACCMFRMKLQKLIPYIRNHVINRQKLGKCFRSSSLTSVTTSSTGRS
jgi:hypothetical protein